MEAESKGDLFGWFAQAFQDERVRLPSVIYQLFEGRVLLSQPALQRARADAQRRGDVSQAARQAFFTREQRLHALANGIARR